MVLLLFSNLLIWWFYLVNEKKYPLKVKRPWTRLFSCYWSLHSYDVNAASLLAFQHPAPAHLPKCKWGNRITTYLVYWNKTKLLGSFPWKFFTFNKTDTAQFSHLQSPPAETRVSINRQILLLSVRVALKNKVRRRENEHQHEYYGVREEGSHSARPRSFIFHSADRIWILWKECPCLPYHALFWGITCALTPQ